LRSTVTPEQAREAIQEYKEIKQACITPGDIMMIDKYGEPTTDPKKKVAEFGKHSLWCSIGRFYHISVTTDDPIFEYGEDSDGKFVCVTVKAHGTDYTGRKVSMTGAVSTRDPFFTRKGNFKKPAKIHDMIMKAETKAFNRVITRLIGGGEVSSDEIYEKMDYPPGKAKIFSNGKKKTEPKSESTPAEATDDTLFPFGDSAIAKSDDIQRVEEWFHRAHEAGMSSSAYNNMYPKFSPKMTVRELYLIEEWLTHHYPDLEQVTK